MLDTTVNNVICQEAFDGELSRAMDATQWALDETRPAFWRRMALRLRLRWLARNVPTFAKRAGQ